jgi:diguanylate cyclase (GGDEF)-like protein
MAQRLRLHTQELEQRVAERTVALEVANRQLEALASTDGLTGVANRRHYDNVVAAEWARAQRSRQPLALILLDVDHFKLYNDRHGHQAGDDVLRAVARVLDAAARRAGDLAARYGGEEFVVVAPNTDAAAAASLAESLRSGVQRLALAHGAVPAGVVTVSVGVAVFMPGSADSLQQLIEQADQALYRAKQLGRNRVEVVAGS